MRSRNKIIIVVIAVLLVLGIITAVVVTRTMQATKSKQSTSSSSSVDASSAVATDTVSIKDFAFSPAVITVKAGTTVTWTNYDAVSHSVTSDDGSAMSFNSGLFANKATYSMKFDKAGTFHYHCTPHPYMKAVVIVT